MDPSGLLVSTRQLSLCRPNHRQRYTQRMLRAILCRPAALAALLLCLSAGTARAAWLHNGTPLCTAAGSQYNVTAIPDGAGGAMVAWEDARNGAADVYCLRITSAGVPASGWPADGVPVCTADFDQSGPHLCSDGAGGAIIAWTDLTPGASTWDIYANHIDGAGHTAAGWPAASTRGVPICTADEHQTGVRIVDDGAGGAFIAWTDERYGGADLVVQHLMQSGSADPQWPVDGLDEFHDTAQQYDPVMLPDGTGGIWLDWSDDRASQINSNLGFDVYFERITASGTPAVGHSSTGFPATTAVQSQGHSTMVHDDAGGVILAWLDYRNASITGVFTSDIYCERIDANAAVHAGWPNTNNDRALCTATGDQDNVLAVPDGAGGAIVTWRDLRAPTPRAYATRVTATSVLAAGWPLNGLSLCSNVSGQTQHVAIADGAGGAFVCWLDLRGADGDIYATRVRGNGTFAPGWPAAGTSVCAVTGDAAAPAMVTDAQGGAFVFWRDLRTDGGDVYAAHLTANGDASLLSVAPPAHASFAFAVRSGNPARGSTVFALTLPAEAAATIRILDVTGRVVRTLSQSVTMSAGEHAIIWDGRDEAGAVAASGVYFARVDAAGVTASARCVRLR